MDYYVYMPIHNNGGVKMFLENKVEGNVHKDGILNWNVEAVLTLQSSLNQTLTPNML